MKSRITNVRVYVTEKVVKAREFIYSGSTVDGVKVEHSLGEGSWVPVLVSTTTSLRFYIELHYLLTEYVCREARTVRTRLIPHASRRLHA
jgi:hypothetical protein